MRVSVDIIQYDKHALTRLLAEEISRVLKETKTIPKLVKAPMLLTLQNIPGGASEKMMNLASDKLVNPMLCNKLSELVNKNLRSKMLREIKITKCTYKKRGEMGMKLEVEIEQIDLDELFAQLIRLADKKGGSGEGKKDQSLVFGMLEALNQDIPASQKLELIQILLQWANQNDLISKVIDELIRQDAQIAETLQPLKLKVGAVEIMN